MPHISRFRLKNSERSGFKHRLIELVKDAPWEVAAEEYDQPPPSRRPLGGEGDVAGEARDSTISIANTATPADVDNPIVYVTAAVSLQPSLVHSWMRVTGSNAAVTLSATPKIIAGQQGQVLTLECVGFNIRITNGDGVAMMGSAPFTMTSGSIVTFLYTTAGNVWQEASRAPAGTIY